MERRRTGPCIHTHVFYECICLDICLQNDISLYRMLRCHATIGCKDFNLKVWVPRVSEDFSGGSNWQFGDYTGLPGHFKGDVTSNPGG